ncbi:hypothetical protein F4777DRAFT_532313 [Nemania sp. FL0916]|nr:hypothetical protein F4777DRAFT_532313 [Nemania sp. FL0916]
MRFAELRQLVEDDGLTRAEMRYLRLLCSSFQTDVIRELPFEIVSMITLQLQPPDFACCLRVSKIWRGLFLSEVILEPYARRWWPAMIDGQVNQDKFLESLSRLGWADYSFRRVRVDPRDSMTIGIPGGYTSSVLYAYGKVAWVLPQSEEVAINDLRLLTPRILDRPFGIRYGQYIRLRALGSKLLIGSVNRELIAWDHVEGQVHTYKVPCMARRCSTQGNRVVTVLESHDTHYVHTWTPGHRALMLNTLLLTSESSMSRDQRMTWQSLLNVFFDPRDDNTLYLTSGYCFVNDTKQHMVRFTVHKLSRSTLVASWFSDHEIDEREFRSNPCHNEEYIEMAGYDVDYSCIFFYFRKNHMNYSYSHRLAVFDKLEQRFIDWEQRD